MVYINHIVDWKTLVNVYFYGGETKNEYLAYNDGFMVTKNYNYLA